MVLFNQNFNLLLRKGNGKNSCERCSYESVDDRSLSSAMSRKKKYSGGLRLMSKIYSVFWLSIFFVIALISSIDGVFSNLNSVNFFFLYSEGITILLTEN